MKQYFFAEQLLCAEYPLCSIPLIYQSLKTGDNGVCDRKYYISLHRLAFTFI